MTYANCAQSPHMHKAQADLGKTLIEISGGLLVVKCDLCAWSRTWALRKICICHVILTQDLIIWVTRSISIKTTTYSDFLWITSVMNITWGTYCNHNWRSQSSCWGGALDSSSLESSCILHSQLPPTLLRSHTAWGEAAVADSSTWAGRYGTLGCPLRALTALTALLSSQGSSSLRSSWNTSPCLSLWLFCRTRYPLMFCYRKSSVPPVSVRHLGLAHHSQRQHLIINLFFPPNTSILH